MQYLSTASAKVFLSSKLSSHNTYRWKNKKWGREVKTAEETGEKSRNKQQIKLYTLVILPSYSH